jgi:hypothetical protein
MKSNTQDWLETHTKMTTTKTTTKCKFKRTKKQKKPGYSFLAMHMAKLCQRYYHCEIFPLKVLLDIYSMYCVNRGSKFSTISHIWSMYVYHGYVARSGWTSMYIISIQYYTHPSWTVCNMPLRMYTYLEQYVPYLNKYNYTNLGHYVPYTFVTLFNLLRILCRWSVCQVRHWAT